MKNIILTTLVLLAISIKMSAAVMVPDPNPFPDQLSLDAMIYNHKVCGAAALTRTTTEGGNYLTHTEDSHQENEYQKVEKQLDYYNRAMNLFGLVLSGFQTGFHTYATVTNVKNGISEYSKLVDEYRTKILSKGALWSTDIQIVDLTGKLVTDMQDEVNQLWKDMMSLAEYGSGLRECKTDVLMCCLNDINEDLDNINNTVNYCYGELYKYMSFRLGYWKKELINARDLHDMARDAAAIAIERWKNSAKKSKGNVNTATKEVTLGHGALLGHEG